MRRIASAPSRRDRTVTGPCASPARAQAPEEFYRGKTINLIIPMRQAAR